MSWQARHRPVSVLAHMALKQERVAQRLADLRERHALSQEKAAQKVGITHRQWQRWENGQSMPRPGNLGEVALAFGVPVTTFYEDDDASTMPAAGQFDRIEQKLDDVLRRLDALEQIQSRLGHLDDDARKTWTELAAHDMEVMSRLDAVERTMRDRSQEEPPR